MYRSLNRFILSTFALVSFAGLAQAQKSDTQGFKVIVPASIDIVAPNDATITHDETNNDQNFPAQGWLVKGNSPAGVSVSFSTTDTFKHTSGNFQRNAGLSLAVDNTTTQGPAVWTVGTATDQTNYASNDAVATVTASSNGIGRTMLQLTVRFITEEFGVFGAGDYNTTVTGTVTAN